MSALDTDALELALGTLQDAVRVYDAHGGPEDEALLLRDGLIQRFEYVYELAWKLMQRWIALNVNPESAVPTWTRRELFRLAAEHGLLRQPADWFVFAEARHLSAHTYNPVHADKALLAARAMIPEALFLLERLRHG
ncbi:MAG: HI0074 family nucleotidyltransferase substrate-binding subunit [bacterium]|jgi:nucleotidyltransferase substrate binding protein (TIGR01987 family)|nr:HI0074 family nucleotidyltransferase substrate-binding subunit [bacterium]